MPRKDGLNVNSTLKEFKEAVKNEKLSLPEAQIIAILIYGKLDSLRRTVNQSYCSHCFKSSINDKILKRTKSEIKMLEKLNRRFYPYIKYDW